MGTHSIPRHRRRSIRIDGLYIGLGLMIASAAIVLFLLWQVAAWWFSLGTYIESSVPR